MKYQKFKVGYAEKARLWGIKSLPTPERQLQKGRG